MENEKNEKVLAMYHAVWKLIEDGKDIHKIKVSDITECAGIGKGTAYEYFRSKEEIVRKAMLYNSSLQFQMLLRDIREQDSYRKRLEACFNWIENTRDKRQLVLQFLGRTEGFLQIPDCLCKDGAEQKKSFMAMAEEIFTDVISQGRTEGLIRESLSDGFAAVQILSQLLGYFVYQELGDIPEKEQILKTKEFLCDNIIKSLC